MPLNMNTPNSSGTLKSALNNYNEFDAISSDGIIKKGETIECLAYLECENLSATGSNISGDYDIFGNRIFTVSAPTTDTIWVNIFEIGSNYKYMNKISVASAKTSFKAQYTVDPIIVAMNSSEAIICYVLTKSINESPYTTYTLIARYVYIDSSNVIHFGTEYVISGAKLDPEFRPSMCKIDNNKILMHTHKYNSYSYQISYMRILQLNSATHSITAGTRYVYDCGSTRTSLYGKRSKLIKVYENTYICTYISTESNGSNYARAFAMKLNTSKTEVSSTAITYVNIDTYNAASSILLSSDPNAGYILCPFRGQSNDYRIIKYEVTDGKTGLSISFRDNYFDHWGRTDIYSEKPIFISTGLTFGYKNCVFFYSVDSSFYESLYRFSNSTDNNVGVLSACTHTTDKSKLSDIWFSTPDNYCESKCLENGSWLTVYSNSNTLHVSHVFCKPTVRKSCGIVDGIALQDITETSGKVHLFLDTH